MKTLNTSWAWEEGSGFYHLPHLLSWTCLAIPSISLAYGWAIAEAYREELPALFRLPPATACAFVLLALSVRLSRWERIDLRSAPQAKVARVLAGLAALLTVGAAMAPIILGVGMCMLAAAVILQAYNSYMAARRVLLASSLTMGTWLVLANLYQVHGRIRSDLTAEPVAGALMFGLALSLSLTETRNGMIPTALRAVLGEKASTRLLVALLVVPLLLGYLRLEVEQIFHIDQNLMLSVQVLATLLVVAVLLVSSMQYVKERIDAQRREQNDLEATETSLRLLLARSSQFYMTMNLAGRLLDANDHAKRALGLPDLQKSVVVVEDYVLPESHEKLRRLPETLLRGVSNHAVLIFRLSDGRDCPIDITAAYRMRGGTATEIVLVGKSLEPATPSSNADSGMLLTA